MSARQSPIERDARQFAAEALREARTYVARSTYVEGTPAYAKFDRAADELRKWTVWAVQRGDMPRARRCARAVELIEREQSRLTARRRRDHTAKLVALGLVEGARARITRGGSKGAEVSVEASEGFGDIRIRDEWGNTHRMSWRDLEAVDVVREAPAVEVRCPECAGLDGAHGSVHIRYEQGGGGWNRPCSRGTRPDPNARPALRLA